MKYWGMFGLLGLIWGSSFLLIKIAVVPDGALAAQVGLFDPLPLATVRMLLGALGFVALMIVTHRKVPTDGRTLFYLVVSGLFNNAIPYALITWGERTIDSGLASVLNATVPLFSLVIAHLALHDDKITPGKIVGLITGFAGVLLLATRSTDPTHPNPLIGQLAVIGASLSYAVAVVFMRRTLRHVEAITTAAVSITAGAVLILIFSLIVVRPLPILTAIQPRAWEAILVLGLVNTFIAYILFFTLMAAWGPSRTTFVTYLLPPLGVALGAIFDAEPLDWKLIASTILIMGGVAAANLWRGKAKTAAQPTPALEAPIIPETSVQPAK
ncbi:MAG: DMT family transporter [Aggregatilineales bacterium]